MNKLEAAFAQVLQLDQHHGVIHWWAFESMKFKLGEGAWFTPDFVTLQADGEIRFYETKGFMREAANVRLKTVSHNYPFRFFLVKHLRGTWQITEVGECESEPEV